MGEFFSKLKTGDTVIVRYKYSGDLGEVVGVTKTMIKVKYGDRGRYYDRFRRSDGYICGGMPFDTTHLEEATQDRIVAIKERYERKELRRVLLSVSAYDLSTDQLRRICKIVQEERDND